jgi:hypothetical protein
MSYRSIIKRAKKPQRWTCKELKADIDRYFREKYGPTPTQTKFKFGKRVSS